MSFNLSANQPQEERKNEDKENSDNPSFIFSENTSINVTDEEKQKKCDEEGNFNENGQNLAQSQDQKNVNNICQKNSQQDNVAAFSTANRNKNDDKQAKHNPDKCFKPSNEIQQLHIEESQIIDQPVNKKVDESDQQQPPQSEDQPVFLQKEERNSKDYDPFETPATPPDETQKKVYDVNPKKVSQLLVQEQSQLSLQPDLQSNNKPIIKESEQKQNSSEAELKQENNNKSDLELGGLKDVRKLQEPLNNLAQDNNPPPKIEELPVINCSKKAEISTEKKSEEGQQKEKQHNLDQKPENYSQEQIKVDNQCQVREVSVINSSFDDPKQKHSHKQESNSIKEKMQEGQQKEPQLNFHQKPENNSQEQIKHDIQSEPKEELMIKNSLDGPMQKLSHEQESNHQNISQEKAKKRELSCILTLKITLILAGFVIFGLIWKLNETSLDSKVLRELNMRNQTSQDKNDQQNEIDDEDSRDLAEMKQKLNDLKRQYHRLEKDFNRVSTSNESLEQNINHLKQSNEQLTMSDRTIQKKYNQLQKEYAGLQFVSNESQNKLNDIQAKFTQFQTYTEGIECELSSIQNSWQQYQYYEKPILKGNLLNYEQQDKIYNQTQFRQKVDLINSYEQSNRQYDAVITVDQFKDLSKNQMYFVYRNLVIKQILCGETSQQSRVGLLGLRNKGKTFLLNQMINDNLPSSNRLSTKGISFKVSQLRKSDTMNTIFMDTEGISKPAQVNWEDVADEDITYDDYFKLIKKSITETDLIEKIQQEVVISFSDIIILVVGYLQHDDQKLIEQTIYHCQYKERERKSLVILHNVKEYTKIEEFQEYYSYIQKHFPLQKQVEDEMVFFTDKRNEQGNIEHLFFADAFSEAGNLINKKTLKYLQDKIKDSKQKFNFEEEVRKIISNIISKYANIKTNNQIQFNVNHKNLLYLSQENCTGNNQILKSIESSIDLNSNDTLCTHIKVNSQYTIENASHLIQDSVGIFHSAITYEIYQREDKVKIYIDTPGKSAIKNIIISKDSTQKLIIDCHRNFLADSELVQSNVSFRDSQYEIQLPVIQSPNRRYRFTSRQSTFERVPDGQYLIDLTIYER